jgi:hypothetical protein
MHTVHRLVVTESIQSKHPSFTLQPQSIWVPTISTTLAAYGRDNTIESDLIERMRQLLKTSRADTIGLRDTEGEFSITATLEWLGGMVPLTLVLMRSDRSVGQGVHGGDRRMCHSTVIPVGRP